MTALILIARDRRPVPHPGMLVQALALHRVPTVGHFSCVVRRVRCGEHQSVVYGDVARRSAAVRLAAAASAARWLASEEEADRGTSPALLTALDVRWSSTPQAHSWTEASRAVWNPFTLTTTQERRRYKESPWRDRSWRHRRSASRL